MDKFVASRASADKHETLHENGAHDGDVKYSEGLFRKIRT